MHNICTDIHKHTYSQMQTEILNFHLKILAMSQVNTVMQKPTGLTPLCIFVQIVSDRWNKLRLSTQ